MSVPHEKPLLLLYSSRFGHSRKIAETIAGEWRTAGLAVELAELTPDIRPEPARHSGLGLVMSVRYGHFARDAFRLARESGTWLQTAPTLLVTVSLTARKPEKRSPETHLYTRKFLKKTGWQPTRVLVAAGALEYSRYNFVDRACIRLIMWLMKGETDGVSTVDYTDWEAVRTAARDFAAGIAGTGTVLPNLNKPAGQTAYCGLT
ncbi:MAG: menaquinone-dependent protoporphyrinogen IX dehydrogenase [Zoogloeaceae bacterium]|jgi:menaquinone-dependent protoporphyrinogen oxidase|nr:menaquinone-dependent protoporphyrinogen IX dehydrogenase [Zoogloeaceae bacterium]